MSRSEHQNREHQDLEHQDVEAALVVRRELGEDYEPALVESFVERIEDAIEARVDARMAERNATARSQEQHQKHQLALGIVSLGTGIPITAVAGGVGDGLAGVIVAWTGIAAVNVAHALQGRRRSS